MSTIRDEVSASDYRRACDRLHFIASILPGCDPDEAAEHWLPELTKQIALVFNFVGSNMTARHVPGYARTVGALEAAKEGRLPPTNEDESPMFPMPEMDR